MVRRPPRSPRPVTLLPYPTLFRSPLRVGARQRDRLGAQRQAVARILEIGAGDDAAVGETQRRADREARIGGVSMDRGHARGVDQRGEVGHGATTSHANGPSTPPTRPTTAPLHKPPGRGAYEGA